MKNLKQYKEKKDLLNTLAQYLCDFSEEAINDHGQFNLVLSGGNSPKALYRLLASNAYKNKIDWKRTYFFFGDERFVPEENVERNSRMAKQTLFTPLRIPTSHIFAVDTSESPEKTAENYTETIVTHFKGNPIAFDCILLGLGEDAHTASLFPNTSVLKETNAEVVSVYVKKLNSYRITMSAPLINAAKHIVFLVFGQSKAKAVFHVLYDKKGSAQHYPAKLIHPEKGELFWFVDAEAMEYSNMKK